MFKSFANANFPKPVRGALAALFVYGSAVTVVNLAPEKFDYVPVLSDVTPVIAEVTQAGVTRTEVISHAEFTRINEVQKRVAEAVDELETELENIATELEESLAQLEQELEQELSASVDAIAQPWETEERCGDWYGGRFCAEYRYESADGDNWRLSWTSHADSEDREEILLTCAGRRVFDWTSEGTLLGEDVGFLAEEFCAL